VCKKKGGLFLFVVFCFMTLYKGDLRRGTFGNYRGKERGRGWGGEGARELLERAERGERGEERRERKN
jgi:hypothetical protein